MLVRQQLRHERKVLGTFSEREELTHLLPSSAELHQLSLLAQQLYQIQVTVIVKSIDGKLKKKKLKALLSDKHEKNRKHLAELNATLSFGGYKFHLFSSPRQYPPACTELHQTSLSFARYLQVTSRYLFRKKHFQVRQSFIVKLRTQPTALKVAAQHWDYSSCRTDPEVQNEAQSQMRFSFFEGNKKP